MKIVKKAYGKLNLGLDVTGKRDDGYHLVRMIMQTVDIYDDLVFEDNESGQIELFANSPQIPTDERNLIWKVAALLKEKYSPDRGVKITLTKRIPVAAGMAGGSADAAAAFHGLNDLWNLGLTRAQMCEMAVKLGADIPYCIMGGTMLSEGIGEILTPLKDMPECSIVVAKPAIGVSTAWVYNELDSRESVEHPDIDGVKEAIENGDLGRMCALIGNVLETVTKEKHSVIGDIERILEDEGAVRAFMTGSGPTVFGIFDDDTKAAKAVEAVKKSGLAPELFLTKPVDPKM
ncbi:MAG: 4-(cytidine 5'-diphospho)-2-C-methyl-D-erythritol kinase [Butyrivibrio sp.]|nr:4-(cytidine 5'-diphospho)-2-C-methyl-D-erythritol kinase [Butyrivibrio sp.]